MQKSIQAKLDSLYEEIILLDEVAGQLSPADNARVDLRRREIRSEIERLQKQTKEVK